MPTTRLQDFQIHSIQLNTLREEMDTSKALSVMRKNKDANGIFTLLEWRRPDGTLYKTSQLADGTPPQYATRTVKYYDANGTSVLQEYAYTLYYDGDALQGEVIQDA